MIPSDLIDNLNAETPKERLYALRVLMAAYDAGAALRPVTGQNVNNHIHTIYSFSPYSPTMAAYLAWDAGLATAGIMDHDSVGGLREFIQAGDIIGIPVTVGFEQRVCFNSTPFAGKRINNTDQDSVAYLAMHGIPHDKIDIAEAYLAPYRQKRNARNILMTQKLNEVVAAAGISLDFETDILPLSQSHNGGSVTERHILFALAAKIMEKVAPGDEVVAFLSDKFDISVSGNNLDRLNDPKEMWYQYYLLGVLKGHFVDRFYIDADEELPDYREFICIAYNIGAIPAYAYLGDIGDSITGDKRPQQFEDAYLDELIAFLADAGFRAITYMPTRNTDAQLQRLIKLCEKHSLFQICGEDINTPFQPFLCKALERDEYQHLISAAWALIDHENGKSLF